MSSLYCLGQLVLWLSENGGTFQTSTEFHKPRHTNSLDCTTDGKHNDKNYYKMGNHRKINLPHFPAHKTHFFPKNVT